MRRFKSLQLGARALLSIVRTPFLPVRSPYLLEDRLVERAGFMTLFVSLIIRRLFLHGCLILGLLHSDLLTSSYRILVLYVMLNALLRW